MYEVTSIDNAQKLFRCKRNAFDLIFITGPCLPDHSCWDEETCVYQWVIEAPGVKITDRSTVNQQSS